MQRKKVGRPSIYSPELAARLCAELAMGRSLRSVCKASDMPSMSAVFEWLREKPDFAQQYARAKAESADALVEELLDIADDSSGDFIEGEDGVKVNHENIQRSRLRVDTRKWIAAKLKPKAYADRVAMDHGLQPENPLAALIAQIQGRTLLPVAMDAERDARAKPEDAE